MIVSSSLKTALLFMISLLYTSVDESGSSSGKVWHYTKQFDGELANFHAGYEIINVIKQDLYLVQFHSNAEVGSGRSLKDVYKRQGTGGRRCMGRISIDYPNDCILI